MPLPPSARRALLTSVRRVVAALPVLVIAGAALALAAVGGGGHGAEEHHAPSVFLLLLNFANFAIYAFLLYRFAWPRISSALRERRDGIVTALEAARKAQAEAEAIKAEYQEKLRTLETEAARARAEVIEIAEIEARNLLEQARHAADRVRNDARLVAEQEVNRARRILQEESAALVARAASELIAKNLTPQDQSRFVSDFVAQAAEAGTGEAVTR